jgi:protein-disulfide isomerase
MKRTKACAPTALGVAAGAAMLLAIACARPATADRVAPADRVSAGSVIATVGERAITTAEVDAKIGNKLLRFRLEAYKQRREVLQEVIASALLEREAARRGVTVKEVLAEEVEKKARPVTEEEAAAVYESAPDRFRTLSPADALRSITESMRRLRLNQRRQAFTKELERAAKVRVLLEPPRVAVDPSDDPSRGPADAPITIVEFSDFQCPYCAQMARILRQVEAQFPGRIRLVFRDFPLPIHKDAAKAAEAAACARDQGKYWEMHDRLFEGYKALALDDLRRYATEVGLKEPKFAACLGQAKHAAEWQQDRADGERYGVTGTARADAGAGGGTHDRPGGARHRLRGRATGWVPGRGGQRRTDDQLGTWARRRRRAGGVPLRAR